MRRLKNRVLAKLNSRLFKSVGVIVSGTAIAHAITFAAMPINTRLYSPTDFSTMAVLTGIISIVAGAACLRFDYAIALPSDDDEALELLVLAISSAAAVSLLMAAILAMAPLSWLQILGEPSAIPWLWVTPIGVALSGMFLAFQMWFVRRRRFGLIVRSKIFQAGSAATTQVGLGLAHQTPLGLILGQILNFGLGFLTLGLAAQRGGELRLRRMKWKNITRTFVKYRRFPIYATWESLANSASIHAPILLIASLSHGPEPGYIALALFLLQAPLVLFGNAVGQVYLAGASEALRAGRLDQYTLESMSALTRLAAAPMAFFAITSPIVFVEVFGAPWSRAGILACWMTPWLFAQFVVSPVSVALYVLDRQKSALLLQVSGLLLRMVSVLLASRILPGFVSESYAASGFVFYGLYFFAVARAINLRWGAVVLMFLKAAPFAAVGAIAGIVIGWIF